MKEGIRIGQILLIGIIVALCLYPILHELGHSFVALVLGAQVLEINMLPLPNVLCDVRNLCVEKTIAIGLGGCLVPFLLSVIVNPKCFWAWYACFTIRWISLLSFVISIVAIIMYKTGESIQHEDMTQIMQMAPQYTWIYTILLGNCIMLDIILIIKSKPIQRCLLFIG